MSLEFKGSASPLDGEGMDVVIGRLGTGAAEIWSLLTVETRGCGFLPDRRPFILYERHIFSRETNHKFDLSYPDISNRAPGGYGAGGANQYDRLSRAIDLDRRAALRSASWGIGQVMGFNAEIAGYGDVEEMVTAMTASETEQLLAVTGEILRNKLDDALRSHDWASFAKGY
ncbi:MAG: N-acetylmuramidase family protein, partial [Syntrophales bacterium]|nr:N-acetylmuramidase family protein [Syntrophales bacterium]